MFSDINKTYFGKRVVKNVTEVDEKGMVTVFFSDDQLPAMETMHETEWESGKSEKPIEKSDQLQEWFVKRTHAMQQALIEKAVSFNPRFADLKKITAWLGDGIIMTYSHAVSRVFGVENFDLHATVDLALSKLEEQGQEITKDWTEAEKTILSLIRSEKVLCNQITNESYFGAIQRKIENLISESVALALGGDDEARRCNVLTDIINQHEKTGSPNGHEGMEQSGTSGADVSIESKNEVSAQGEGDKHA